MELLTQLFSYVFGPAVAAWLGWFFGRRKASAEADATELDNVEKGLSIYRKIIEDVIKTQEELRLEFSVVKEENAKLKSKVATIEADWEKSKTENKGLRTENEKLRKRVAILEKEIDELKNNQ